MNQPGLSSHLRHCNDTDLEMRKNIENINRSIIVFVQNTIISPIAGSERDWYLLLVTSSQVCVTHFMSNMDGDGVIADDSMSK